MDEIHAAGLLGQHFLYGKIPIQMADEDSHSIDSSVSGDEGHSDPL